MAEGKVTWGSYFASYVKKKPAAVESTATPPPTDEAPSTNKSPTASVGALTGTETKPKPVLVRKPSDGFQKSETSSKKLYAISKPALGSEVPTIQQSRSNASRLAKMFGYTENGTMSPALSEKTEALSGAPLIAMAGSPSNPAVFSTSNNVANKPTARVPEAKMASVVEAALLKKKDDAAMPVNPKLKKSEVQDMLDSFASQAEAPVKKDPANSARKDETLIPNATVMAVNAPTRKPSRTKSNAIDMLDFFANQLDDPNNMLALPNDTQVRNPSQKDTEKAEEIATPAKPKAKALDMLGFFASQLDSTDELFDLPKEEKTDTVKGGSTIVASAATEPVQVAKQSDVPKPDPTTSSPPSFMNYLRPKASLKSKQATQSTTAPPSRARRDSVWSRQGSATSSELHAVMNDSKNHTRSQQSSRTSSELSMIRKGTKDAVWSRRQSSSSSSERSMSISRTGSKYDGGDEILKLEREKMEAERERMLVLEKQAELIIYERQQMEMERQKMREEQMKFEEEARRIAEEEESMKRFLENVERERKLDLENQEKKRLRKEAEERAQREAAEAERRRIAAEEEAERRRLEAEEVARREAERARIEMENEARRAAELAAEREMEEERKRIAALEREQYRLAKEEADRLAAERKEYEEQERKKEEARQQRKAEKERERYEMELAEEEERVRELEWQAQQAEEERQERLQYEAQRADEEARARELQWKRQQATDFAVDQAQAREEERREKEYRRAIKERADRAYQREEAERVQAIGVTTLADSYQFETGTADKPMISPSVYREDEEEHGETKEETLQKAEAKIRMAFANLADERAQPPSAAIPRSNTTRDVSGNMRNNTQNAPRNMQYAGMPTAGRDMRFRNQNAMPDGPVSRFNTVAGTGAPRPAIRGGLPSGPRMGVGLPSGPGPRRRQ